MILKFKILIILTILFLTPAFISAQEKSDPGAEKPKDSNKLTIKKIDDAVITRDDSNRKRSDELIEFPLIDGWRREKVQTYPTAALGYSVTYESEDGGRATVYVYNAGLESIPDGADDKVIKAEIARVKSEIIQIGKMGVYEGVKEIKDDTVTLGGTSGKVKSLRSLLSYKIKGSKVDSEIYLFGYDNNFIKIRSTRPSANGADNKALLELLAEIDKLFAK